MASIRQGYLDDYSQQNQNVGIGTSIPKEKLEIHGGVTSKDLSVTGIATITSVSGFIGKKLEYAENVDLDAGDSATLSDVIVVGVGRTMTIGTGVTAGQGNIDSLKVYKMFQPPSGTTNQRPVGKPGSLFYNTDFKTVEFFDGNSWRQVDNTTRSGRALFGGGDDENGVMSNISSLQFMTLGSAVIFGDLTQARTNAGGCSSEIRAVFAGGEAPSTTNTIDYNAIASGGAGADFGNLASNHRYKAGCSSSTRGLFGAGSTPSATNVIEYVEIMTTGDAIDFGDLMGNGMINSGSFASRTRGFFVDKGVSADQECQVVTIASKGNAISYLPQGLPGGDQAGDAGRGCSNSLRGIFVGAGQTRNIDAVNLVSDGMATQFGDMTEAKYGVGCSASPIRGILYSGWTASPTVRKNTIEYVTFATMGNAVDFGDATHKIRETSSNVSDCHGGLGGF